MPGDSCAPKGYSQLFPPLNAPCGEKMSTHGNAVTDLNRPEHLLGHRQQDDLQGPQEGVLIPGGHRGRVRVTAMSSDAAVSLSMAQTLPQFQPWRCCGGP